MSLQQIKLKLIVAGDHEVGKTSLVRRYLGKGFSPKYDPTLGVDILSKNYKKDNLIIDLRIWDLAGQILFRDLSSGYIKGADLVIIVYDVSRTDSYSNVVGWYKKIYEVLHRSKSENVPCMIIGNKIDLQEERIVDMDQGLQIAEDLNSLYVETSAKEGEGVSEAFEQLIIEYIEAYRELNE